MSRLRWISLLVLLLNLIGEGVIFHNQQTLREKIRNMPTVKPCSRDSLPGEACWITWGGSKT